MLHKYNKKRNKEEQELLALLERLLPKALVFIKATLPQELVYDSSLPSIKLSYEHKINIYGTHKELVHACCMEGREIVFYIDSIKRTASEHSWNMEAYLTRIVVHEMMHYLHFQMVASCPSNNCALEKIQTVRESLARYVEWRWCEQNGFTEQVEDILDGLKDATKNSPVYPYAGAKRLILEEKGAQLFAEALEASCTSWRSAYDILCYK